MPMSEKQKQIIRFPYMPQYDAIICDGAVRSGKTSWMSLSFVLWAMGAYDRKNFAICSKSVGAAERNIIRPLLGIKYLRDNFELRYNRSSHEMIVRRGSRENRFYIFGGRDESSASLIQGLTAAGALLDEVALMPRSFVEQTLARCSVPGAKLWFNCNPEGPRHWFYQTWILGAEKMRALHLHFTLDDNPGLTEETKAQYRNRYRGTFYERYILGRWVLAEGLIYPNFSEEQHGYRGALDPAIKRRALRYIAIDYGIHNPTVFLDIYLDGDQVYIDNEYYYDSRADENAEQIHPQLPDIKHYEALVDFIEGETYEMMQGQYKVTRVKRPVDIIIDPSAASFIAQIEMDGRYSVQQADNSVLDGIRNMSTLLATDKLHISLERCPSMISELYEYRWDEKAKEDKPVKEFDHAMDAARYWCQTIYVNERGLIYGE